MEHITKKENTMRFFGACTLSAILLIPLCLSAKESGTPKSTAYAVSQKEISTALAVLDKEGKPRTPDFFTVEKVYRQAFAPLARTCDEKGIAVSFDSAIARGKRNFDIAIQKQWFDKGIQLICYHTALRIMDNKSTLDKASQDSLADLLACLEPVMDRRSKGQNNGASFKDQVRLATANLSNSSADSARVQINIIKAVLEKVYLLSALWETKGIKVAQGKNDGSADVKRIEGILYLRVLSPSIKDPAILSSLYAEWNKPAPDINPETIRTQLENALPKLWKEIPDSAKNF
jgi:hypothetical protein